jgi:hypothetical protein
LSISTVNGFLVLAGDGADDMILHQRFHNLLRFCQQKRTQRNGTEQLAVRAGDIGGVEVPESVPVWRMWSIACAAACPCAK